VRVVAKHVFTFFSSSRPLISAVAKNAYGERILRIGPFRRIHAAARGQGRTNTTRRGGTRVSR
jgi:hypothetical protein